jgi:hypothetical protein
MSAAAVLFLLLALPGLALLVFLVVQFVHRGQREIDQAEETEDDDPMRRR